MLRLFVSVSLALVFFSSAYAADENCEKALSPYAKNNPDRIDRKNALSAVTAFNNYFNAIGKKLYEREYILEVAKLALLSEEHVLLMGPPGNAKSLLADTILGNIKLASGQGSYYRIQMTPETTQSETHGPLDFKALNETGKYVRILEEGMLLSRNVFIDEIFDARSNALRNILGMLNERAHAQGTHITKGEIETAFAATNRYISEVYERAGDDGPKAVIDRFAFSAFVPGEFMSTDSYVTLIQGAKKAGVSIPALAFDDLEKLRALVPQVQIPDHAAHFLALLSTRMKAETEALEQSSIKNYKEKIRNGEEPGIPYRSTKYHSPRTLSKAASALKAIVVADWIKKGGKRLLVADIDDIIQLEKFFTLNGPTSEFIQMTIESTSSSHERAQLMAILQEREIFKKHYHDLLTEMNDVMIQFALHDLQAEMLMATSEQDKDKIAEKIMGFMVTLETELSVNGFHSTSSGREIGLKLVKAQYAEMLQDLLGAKGEALVAEIKRRHDEQVAAEVARRQAEAAEAERVVREEHAAIAAAAAQRAAEEKKVAKFIESLKANIENRKVLLSNTFVSSSESIRYAVDKVNKRVLLADISNGSYRLISYVNEEEISSKELSLALHNVDGAPREIHFTDENNALFINQDTNVATIVGLKDENFEAVPLTQDDSARSTYNPITKTLYAVGSEGLSIFKLGSNGVKKKKITFTDDEAESLFDGQLKQYGVGEIKSSPDGKHVTFTDAYNNHQWVVRTADGKVISHEALFDTNVNITRGAGHNGECNNQIILPELVDGKIKFKLFDMNGELQSSYGISQIGESSFYYAIYSSNVVLWNSTNNTIESLEYDNGLFNSSSGEFTTPIDLGDGLLGLFVYENNHYRFKIVKNK